MKNVFNKIKKLSIHKKLRILSIFLIFAVLSFCVTAYLKTYSEYVSNPNNLNGVNGEYVYINDADADWYFYMGRNYTSNNGQLPTFTDKNLYNENNLVETTVTYNGRDILYNQTGYVSNTERQNKYVYYRFFPVNDNGTANDTSDDYIEIELIDTPFTARPNNLAFNGWITNYAGATITLDMDYYLRYAKVPVTYQNNKPKHIDITFTANWIPATTSEMTTSWSTAFGRLNSVSMVPVTTHTKSYNYNMNGYYTAVEIDWYDSCRYYYNSSGTYQNRNCTCYDYNGCTYYQLVNNENYDDQKEYFELINNQMTPVNMDDLGITPIITYLNPYASSSNMAGYFRKKNLNPGSSRVGYYDDDGTKLTGNCPNNGNCTVYEFIQYYKPGTNEQEKLDLDETYYYLVTRDTNIVYMTRSYSGNWGTNNAKPFTLTTLHNGTKYNVTWTLNNTYVRCTTDTRIENITIETRASYQVTSSPSSSSTASRYFFGNFYNVKIGRGVVSSNSSYATFLAALGGNNSSASSGSSGSPHRYTFAVESGFYGNMSLTNASNSNSSHYTIYTEMKGVYGNDYDRVKKDNTKLLVYFCASGSWNDNYYASSNTKLLFDLTVKSGRFGLYKTDDTSGIYVGGRTGGTHNAARRAKIEGGDIFSLIGGPLSASSQASYNDTYIDMVGGEVAVMIGGAGETATYGNRILQITGGTVSHAVFGGSNGFESGEGNGTVNGSSYIYVGGKATIGDTDLDQEDDNLYGEEIGSVFGIGNGRSGYSSIGSSDNSYIVIADKATINQSVYGGGNFGATGVSSTSNTSESKIKIIGGTIKGSVYGGGNSNGSGNSSKTSSISIEMTSGKVEGSIYGGSNKEGTVYGSTSVNVTGGTVSGNVYGGGKGGYTDSNNPGTFVTRAVSVVIGNSSSSVAPTITGSVYGGSAFGTVNGGSNTTNVSSYNTTVTVNKGTITNVFGGGQGDSTYTPYVEGNVTVNINNGNITNVFGGNDLAGTPNGTVTVNLNNGTISNSIYGGGNQAPVNNTNVNLNGGSAVNAFGGSNQAGASTTTVRLAGASITNLYGGSNQTGDITTTNVTTTSGSCTKLYGGNNAGGTVTTTNVTINGGSIGTIYGGGKSAPVGTTNVNLNASTITNVFGGGEAADVTTGTYIRLNGSSVTNIYGGSDSSGTVLASNITTTTGSVGTIYGGNNLGGTTTTTNITVNGGTINKIYGGGKQASSGTTNVNLNASSISSVFGGGEAADVTTGTNVILAGSTVGTLYGGSDSSGTVLASSIIEMAGTATTIYGGNNLGGTTTTSTINISGGNATNVYGGGNVAATTTSNVTISTPNTITNVFGGGKSANVTTTNVTLSNGKVTNLYGGSNTSGTVNQSNITINGSSSEVSTVYGGNNAGGTTTNANLDINAGTIGYVYGGGNEATTNSVVLDINGATITHDVYGGGNRAGINANVDLDIISSSVGGTIFGGGNLGAVGGNTDVYVSSTSVGGSIYAGGNGITAIVSGNSDLNIDGTTSVTGSVFGGGNAADTGTELNDNSRVTVNIAGATIGGNVYGGANTAKIYGSTTLNIGKNAVNKNGLTTGNVVITGTIFGGGEANASGSEIFDWSFISVTKGIDMVIDGSEHTVFSSTGSIFGSGNASSSGGVSNLTIRNYGTRANPQKNISIQRANHVVISNSVIDFSGIADRTNVEFSDTPFTIARVDDLKIKNNTVLYLQTGTNYLKSFGSYVDVTTNGNTTEELATVQINENTGAVTRNVDNRLYVWEGKNINIANDLNATSFGPVYGMTFFGLFNHDRNGNVVTALYDPSYSNGDAIPSNDLGYFSDGGYVMGLHKLNHNIKVDGFYSNRDDEDNAGHIETFYIEPTPPEGDSYKWVVGALVSAYNIELVASKYSTLGGVELALSDYSAPDVIFSILGFNYNELDSNVELINPSSIPRVASTPQAADNNMGLVMQTSNVGWKNNALTTFKTDNNNLITGSRDYIAESSNITPSLIFFLYHSKNLSTAHDMGKVTVSLQVETPINAISSKIERLNINISLSRKLISTNEYEGTITAGKKYEIFANTTTNVTSDSSISTYYALYVESDNNVYGTGYYHALVSTFVFPEKTKITMINYATEGMPEYYYYVVSASDVIAAQQEYNLYGEASYKLEKFIKMGSSSNNNIYDEAAHNAVYYDSTNKVAEEEFIFIVDFEESNITTNQLNKTLFIELRNNNDQTLISVLGTQQQVMKYSLYANSKAEIEVSSELSNNPVYLGKTTYFTATTAVHQQSVNNIAVQDTNTFNDKLGIKITIYDSENHQVDGYSLMGVYFELNNVKYYPRIDGSYRIKLADRIVNVTARMKFGTENSSLASGHYKIKVESFGSADGIYYGLEASDSATLNFEFVNAVYGLKITMNEKMMFIDKDTGKTLNDNNTLSFTTQYNSTLSNPSLRYALYRRDYTTEYSTNYVLVDLRDYVTNNLTATNESMIYLLSNNPPTNFPTYLTTKPNLVTGTYKLVVSVYDNGIYIGDSHVFIFIK